MKPMSLETARFIINRAKTKNGKGSLRQLRVAVKEKTSRKNFKEIFKNFLPYIQEKRNIDKLKYEIFIRGNIDIRKKEKEEQGILFRYFNHCGRELDIFEKTYPEHLEKMRKLLNI